MAFGQISGVKADHTGKQCLSPVESGYSNSRTCCKVRLQSRFTAKKKDHHHNNINTRECSETKDSVDSGESRNPWKLRSKNKVDEQKSWKRVSAQKVTRLPARMCSQEEAM